MKYFFSTIGILFLGLACADSGQIGIAQENVLVMEKPYPAAYTNIANSIVDTVRTGDTLSVVKSYYEKDFVVYVVKYKGKKGYVFSGDDIQFLEQ